MYSRWKNKWPEKKINESFCFLADRWLTYIACLLAGTQIILYIDPDKKAFFLVWYNCHDGPDYDCLTIYIYIYFFTICDGRVDKWANTQEQYMSIPTITSPLALIWANNLLKACYAKVHKDPTRKKHLALPLYVINICQACKHHWTP